MSGPAISSATRSRPAGGDDLPVIDPCDGKPFARFARGNAADIDAAVHAARAAFDGAWGKLAPVDEAASLTPLSRAIAEHVDELALIEQRDCGKPIKQARADAVAWCATSSSMPAPATSCTARPSPTRTATACFTWREPHGVTGHIIPWNYPMQIFGRSVGGALAAGNACVVKPAEDACLSLIRVAAAGGRGRLPGRRDQHRDRLRP